MDISPDASARMTTPTNASVSLSPKKRGRPMKNFTDCSKKSKNRKVSDLIAQYSLEELEFAVQSKRKGIVENQKCLSNSKALALYMDLGLSERKYIVLRKVINDLHPNCLPSLYTLRYEKLNENLGQKPCTSKNNSTGMDTSPDASARMTTPTNVSLSLSPKKRGRPMKNSTDSKKS